MSADDKHDPHPMTGTYLAIAAILTAITLLEVGVFVWCRVHDALRVQLGL